MSINTDTLHQYLNDLLQIHLYKDYCPNGLQVEGAKTVNRLICGVTASQALIDKAVEQQADAILVHHGFFWKNESQVIIGMKKRRIEQLIKHDINLLAYHLPLDAHLTFGNNVQLAHKLKLEITGQLNTETQPSIGIVARPAQPLTPEALYKMIDQTLSRAPIHIASGKKTIKTIGICTGGAQGFVKNAAEQGLDAYISGEISENTTHIARESGIEYYAAGHHASERYGAAALSEHLQHKFNIQTHFIDIDNPA